MASGTIVPGFLSESSNGRQIKVAATASSGTLMHTSVAGTAKIDLVTIEAVNTHTGDVVLTVQWGGTTDPNDAVEVILPSQEGVRLIVDGRRINNGLAIRAFASVANVVLIYGEVDTIEL